MIKCVLFDLDNTIYQEQDYFRQIFLKFACDADISKEAIDRYLQDFDLIRVSEPDIFRHFLTTVREFRKQEHDILFDLYRNISLRLTPNPGFIPILDAAIENNIVVSVLTNGVPLAQRNKWESLSVSKTYRIRFFTSRELFRDKPNSQTFENWRKEMNVNWENVLSIGDNYENDLKYPVSKGAKGILLQNIRGGVQDQRSHLVANLDQALNSFHEILI